MVEHSLQQNLDLLQSLFEEVVGEQVGSATLALAERLRGLARLHREGDAPALAELNHLLATLEPASIRIVARALTLWFDLVNLAEDRQRVAVLRQRERASHPAPRRESLHEAIAALQNAGWSVAQTGELLARLHIELVLTAHPTEAKRRTVRDQLRRLRQDLLHWQQPDLLAREEEAVLARMRGELTALWQTDLIRPYAPSVLDEVARGLQLLDTLWEVVPQTYLDLQQALARVYPNPPGPLPVLLSYASWIGGDRDGHPHVTAEVTRQTLLLLRQATVSRHLERCRSLHRALSLSDRHGPPGQELTQALHQALQCWPRLARRVESVSPHETCRRFLVMIQWRLEQTLKAAPSLLDDGLSGAEEGWYSHPDQLLADLRRLHESLSRRQALALAQTVIEPWMFGVRIFGFHGYRLDVRQESRYYATVMDELLGAIFPDQVKNLHDEETRCRLLTQSMASTPVPPEERLSAQTRETLALFRLLRRATDALGPQCLGGHVISQTHQVSDVLSVLWLACWAGLSPQGENLLGDPCPTACPSESGNTSGDVSGSFPGGGGGGGGRDGVVRPVLAIVPLFETIDDLQRGPGMLEAMLGHPAYRRHVQSLGNRQTVMIGYSDSTKDGGYLAACWNLYEAQQQLLEVTGRHAVVLTFFHGRGGSLGRGGGPTARAIASQPPGSVRQGLRMTEQGEVLAERYDDPQIAHRHLEQVLSAAIATAARPGSPPWSSWVAVMRELARTSHDWYRRLIEHPGFMLFFESATPIQLIADLQIGSRPSRRHGMKELSDLRAIPWVFSWTQSRLMIPAWFGLGHAGRRFLEQEARPRLQMLRQMYEQWPFFRATLDNAALALAKTDLAIARRYTERVEDPLLRGELWETIRQEHQDARTLALEILQVEDLLDDTPWLKTSIAARQTYLDPLNLMQIELLRRLREKQKQGAPEAELAELRDLLRVTIQGVAAGVRTTG